MESSYILGIESTCDETAAAVVANGHKILSNVVGSQADLHERYGGVVPELACRRHVETIIPIIDQALQDASMTLEQIDAIAVAQGPGLIGALLVGINTAKALALTTGKPLVAVNHIEAHLYAAVMSHEEPPPFPCLGAVISGGHTALVKMEAIGSYQMLGHTVDDAAGEAFDKVAKLLGLPYPGGPEIERLAQRGNPHAHPFRGGQVKGRPLHFSFSGLKTAVLYAVKGKGAKPETSPSLTVVDKADIAASFQRAAIDDLTDKIVTATQQEGCETILLGGGVVNNSSLRAALADKAGAFDVRWPAARLTLDNAAMIAGLGYHTLRRNGPSPLTFHAETRLPL